MKICLGIIANTLDQKVMFRNYDQTKDPFILERARIYKPGDLFEDGVLYIARAEDLPAETRGNRNASLICIGSPPMALMKNAMHLIALKQGTDPVDVINRVNEIFYDYAGLEYRLQKAVSEGLDIQSLVDLIAPYFSGNEIMVHNSAYKFIGHSNEQLHTNELSGVGQFDEEKYIAPDVLSYFKNDIIYSQVRDLAEPFFYGPSILICRTLCMNVNYKDEYAARIILAEDVTPFLGYEPELLKFFHQFVQALFNSTGIPADILPQRKLQDALQNLLQGTDMEDQQLQNYMQSYGWKKADHFVCGILLPSDRDAFNRTTGFYVRTFNQDMPGCCFTEYENRIAFVVNLSYYKDQVSKFIEENIECFRDNYFKAGYSDTFTSLHELKQYHCQASIALQYGMRNSGHHWYFRFPDVRNLYIRAMCTQELSAKYLCAREVIKLKQYDEANNTQLLQTLECYLQNTQNAVQTAKKLFISRTAMLYRLKRISELTELDFGNYKLMLNVMLSLELFVNED